MSVLVNKKKIKKIKHSALKERKKTWHSFNLLNHPIWNCNFVGSGSIGAVRKREAAFIYSFVIVIVFSVFPFVTERMGVPDPSICPAVCRRRRRPASFLFQGSLETGIFSFPFILPFIISGTTTILSTKLKNSKNLKGEEEEEGADRLVVSGI